MREKTFKEVYEEIGTNIYLADGEAKSIPNTIRNVAKNGWKRISVKGTPLMCKVAWLEASRYGIEVEGFKPTDRDIAELEKLKLERREIDSLKMIDAILSADEISRGLKKR